MALSSNTTPPAATTPIRSAPCAEMTWASPCMVSGMSRTWRRSDRAGLPSGSLAAMAVTMACKRRWPPAPGGCRLGSAFALAEESGMRSDYRSAIFSELKRGADDAALVRTTMVSPTGFSFKVAQIKNTLSEPEIYADRRRVCDLGLLQQIGLSKPDESGGAITFSALRLRSHRKLRQQTRAGQKHRGAPVPVQWPARLCRSGPGQGAARRTCRRAGDRHPGQPPGRCAPPFAQRPVPLLGRGRGGRYSRRRRRKCIAGSTPALPAVGAGG